MNNELEKAKNFKSGGDPGIGAVLEGSLWGMSGPADKT